MHNRTWLRILLPVGEVHCQKGMRKRGLVSWPYWLWEFYILIIKKLVIAFWKNDGRLRCFVSHVQVVMVCTLEVRYGIPSFRINQITLNKHSAQQDGSQSAVSVISEAFFAWVLPKLQCQKITSRTFQS